MKPLTGLEVRSTLNNGLGLYAAQVFREGGRVCELGGQPVEAGGPRFQVGADEYIGPAGTVADALNHSCNPNAWVEITKGYPVIAMRDIADGEEVTIDYSITHTADEKFFVCKCKAINCRRVVGGFDTIPAWQREHYITLRMVPAYVLDKFLPLLVG